MIRRLTIGSGWLALYAGAVVLATWPLAHHASTHLPRPWAAAPADAWFVTWLLAYLSRRLVSDPGALADAPVYHPTPGALFYTDAAIGAVPFFLPTYLATGNPVLALNVMLLVCLALTAGALHLVVHRWTGSHLAGLVAGSTFLLTRWVLWSWIPCVPFYVVLPYFPLILLAAAELRREPLRAAALTVLVFLQGLVSSYLALAATLPLLGLAAFRMARPRTRAAGLTLLASVLVALALLVPFVLPYAAIRSAEPRIAEQTTWPARFETEAPLGSFSYWAPMGVPSVALALAGIGGVLLARRLRLARGLAATRGTAGSARLAWANAGYWAIAGLVISSTPTVRVQGEAVRLPQALLGAVLPVYDVIRAPARLGVAGLMGLCVLAGLGFAECARPRSGEGHDRARRRWPVLLAVLVLAGMGTEYLLGTATPGLGRLRTQTYWVSAPQLPAPIRMPEAFLVLGEIPRRYPLAETTALEEPVLEALRGASGALLEIPVDRPGIDSILQTRGGSPVLQTRAMVRSLAHPLPLLNGYGSFWPAGFAERMDLARRLPEPDALDALRREAGLTTLLVDLEDMTGTDRTIWRELAGTGREDLLPVAVTDRQVVFRVRPGPPADPEPPGSR